MAGDAESVAPNYGKYSSIEWWLNLLFQRGALAVAETFGTVLIMRAVFSPSFSLEAGALGASLLMLGILFEYLIWIRTTVFVTRRVDVLDKQQKAISAQAMELYRAALQGAPRGAAGTPEGK